MIELRLVDSLDDKGFMALPVVHKGNIDSAIHYAESQGYEWRSKQNYMYGGYWVNANARNCLMPW